MDYFADFYAGLTRVASAQNVLAGTFSATFEDCNGERITVEYPPTSSPREALEALYSV